MRCYRIVDLNLNIIGKEDGVITAKGKTFDEPVYKNVSTVTFKFILRAGHMLMIEKIKEVSDNINAFISA